MHAEAKLSVRREDVCQQIPQSQIRIAIKSFLKGCGLLIPVCDKYAEFRAQCVSTSIARGYITPENDVLHRFIYAGVSMACNAYSHQPDNIQVFICLYTAFLVYLDDTFQKDIEAVRQFNHRFITREPQKRELLDHFAALLLEMPTIFGTVVANIMTTSTLNLVTALSIEHEVETAKLEPSAHRFPAFSRVMSGASETYALFMFPPGLPLIHQIQALPDCMVYINNGNDILSCYKEQLACETVNKIYLTAQCRGVSQAIVLQELADEAVAAHRRVLEILKPHKRCLAAYISFSQGYIGFHSALERYRLYELDLHV